MYASGVLSWDETMLRLKSGFERGRRDLRGGNLSVPEISEQLNRVRAYRRMYWGGAGYFLAVDHRLSLEKDTRLATVLKQYLDCCWRLHRGNAHSMMRQLDRLSDSTIFVDTYNDLMEQPGFPVSDKALAWLAKNPPELRAPPKTN